MRATPQSFSELRRKKVYGVALRAVHAWNGLAIVFLLLSAWGADALDFGAEKKAAWLLHILGGYALVIGLVSRFVLGLIGGRHSRWSSFWHPRLWLASFRSRRLSSLKPFGHDPYASLAYLALYGVLFLMAATGLSLAAIEHDLGPLRQWLFDAVQFEELVEEPHEAGAYFVLGFIVTHLAAMIWHERKEGVPLVQSMISGFQYRVRSKGEKK